MKRNNNNPRAPLEEPYRDWAKRDAEQAGYEINSEEAVPVCCTFIRNGPRPGPPLAGPGPVLFDGRAAVLALVGFLLAVLAVVAFFLG